MQFRVPQFIDIEDKIVGPLTLKQFGYLLSGGGFSFLIWTFIPIGIIAIILIIPVMGLFLALSFYKYNDRPFADLLENAFRHYTESRIYTWKQPEAREVKSTNNGPQIKQTPSVATFDRNRLQDISLGLDVLDRKSQENDR